jgi:tRNA 2-thiouridine synthesizing protein C
VEKKNFSPTYNALGDYDINKLYVEQESLAERGLSEDDLMDITYEDEDDDWAEKPSIRIVSRAELAALMEEQDVVFSF